MRRSIIVAAAAALLFPGQANADWHVATSEHFIIYSEAKTKELEEFATNLEKFDTVVRWARHMQDRPIGDGNRLTVYVVGNIGEVRDAFRGTATNVAGFYQGGYTGPYAVVPLRAGSSSIGSLTDEIIFFHEYGHHLMLQDYATPMPGWLSEGFAELVSTAKFEKNGNVGLGLPANHRGWEVFFNKGISIEKLLAGDYSKLDSVESGTLYARSWMLTHYLTFDAERSGQLDAYLARIKNGEDSLDAARAVFGDLDELEKGMERHSRARRLPYASFPFNQTDVSPIEVRKLTPGEEAILPLRMTSKLGVDDTTAGPLANKIRAVAARYPNELLVLRTLAEAEHDDDKLDAADAAADAALAIKPNDVEALIYKGRVAMKRAADAEGEARANHADQARQWYLKANGADPFDPEPMFLYFNSFAAEQQPADDLAKQLLQRAVTLIPQDRSVRMAAIVQALIDGNARVARILLGPIAFEPHGGGGNGKIRDAIARVNEGDTGGALEILTIKLEDVDADDGDGGDGDGKKGKDE